MLNKYTSTTRLASAVRIALVIGVGLLLLSDASLAQADDGTGLGDGICAVVNILTGKWLFGITLLATVAGVSALLFGAELTDAIKKLATIVTVVALILGMTGLLTLAFSKFTTFVPCS